ncbi:MAG: Maf family protein [Phycisphaerae bacterium]
MNPGIQPDRLVLASSSRRRSALLREAGYRFEIAAPAVDEPVTTDPTIAPASHAESLAYFKASSVAGACPDRTILGADTIAVVDGEIIGKPADRDDARRILRRLSKTTHVVITGVAVIHPKRARRLIQHDVSRLRVRALSDSEIEAYLDTGTWEGKAGAYGVQDRGDRFVERIEGSFSNVVGLPMELLGRMFERWRNGRPSGAPI